MKSGRETTEQKLPDHADTISCGSYETISQFLGLRLLAGQPYEFRCFESTSLASKHCLS